MVGCPQKRLFACLLRHTTATTATTAALLQPRQRDSHAESARCQDLQFVTSPVSKWWLRAPASRAGGSAAARHSLSLQPPASASASADGLLGPWRRCRPAAPQRGHHGTAKHGMPKRGGRKPRTGAKSLAVNKRDERHRFCVKPAVCTNRCCSVELFFGWRNGGILNEQYKNGGAQHALSFSKDKREPVSRDVGRFALKRKR